MSNDPNIKDLHLLNVTPAEEWWAPLYAGPRTLPIEEACEIIREIQKDVVKSLLDSSNPWKPMNTAPIDGSYILVYLDNDEIFKVSYIEAFSNYDSGFYTDSGVRPIDPMKIKCWMPIVEPPLEFWNSKNKHTKQL